MLPVSTAFRNGAKSFCVLCSHNTWTITAGRITENLNSTFTNQDMTNSQSHQTDELISTWPSSSTLLESMESAATALRLCRDLQGARQSLATIRCRLYLIIQTL